MIKTCKFCGQKNRVRAESLGAPLRCGKCKKTLDPIDEPIDADNTIFDEVLRNAKVPVLVDFWAEWCGPCHMAAPEVQRVAAEMAGRALVLKVNTERHADLAERFNIRSIPNFIVLKNGKLVHQQPGVVRSAQMKEWLESAK